MSLDLARTVADAVLYEGYLLYPYRATAGKNQVRWQFGVLGPPAAAARGVGEESSMRTECLVRPRAGADVRVHLRFLQLQARLVERADSRSATGFTPVDRLVVDGTDLRTWDEATEHDVELGPFSLAELSACSVGAPLEVSVEIPGGDDVQPVSRNDTAPAGRSEAAPAGRSEAAPAGRSEAAPAGRSEAAPAGRSEAAPAGRSEAAPAGRVIRRRWPLEATVRLAVVGPSEAPAVDEPDGAPGIVRLSVEVSNRSTPPGSDRESATRASFLGAHLLMQVSHAAFVSLLEPPDELAGAAAACRNERCWPVLVGIEGQTDIVLASPIILYDYPAVAPESAGALFDSTEIDEILTLRVMALTDEEKAEARATDPAAAAIIDRCEQMSPEAMQLLHGVLRDPRAVLERVPRWSADDVPTFATPGGGSSVDPPAPDGPWWDPGVDAAVSPATDAVVIAGVTVAKGSRVVLHPRRHADAQDLFYADRVATVSGIFFDVDGEVHVAVVLADDPASDLHEWYGRYLYFSPDEVRPLDRPAPDDPSRTQGD